METGLLVPPRTRFHLSVGIDLFEYQEAQEKPDIYFQMSWTAQSAF